MNKNDILFETKVVPKEGSPYLGTKRKVQLLITTEEIRLHDPKWSYIIPLGKIFDCTAKPMSEKRVVASAWSAPSMIEVMNNYLLIDYLDESGQRKKLSAIFAKHLMIKSNVIEAIRFSETIEKYHLRDKFIKE